MKNLNKLLILILSWLLLTSCWGWEENSSLQKYEWDDFSINVPTAWEIIDNGDEILPSPNVWNIELAVTSSDIDGGFANTLLVLSQDLSKDTTSKDYSRLNNVGSNKDYVNYVSLDNKEFVFNDEDKSNLYTFEAKYNTTTAEYKFLQVWKVCNKKWYLLTVGLSLDVTDTGKYEDFLKTFTCKTWQNS